MKAPNSNKKIKKVNTGLRLSNITGITENQKKFFRSYGKFQVISLIGSAGTGKTFLSMHQALNDVEKGDVDKILIIRSSVPTRNMGFLPGTRKEKMEEYEAPYRNICNELYGRSDSYQILKGKSILEFDSSSYLRGTTFNNCVVILDEAQNCSRGELYTIMTRIGENCRLVLCGDTKQDDLTSERFKEESGLKWLLSKLDLMDNYYCGIEFQTQDIVRSGFVKDFIKVTEL